jgi:hypothetical protein
MFENVQILHKLGLNKESRLGVPEKFYADVEYNYSVDNVNAQPTNRYWLGHFQKHESSSAFSSHHCFISFI